MMLQKKISPAAAGFHMPGEYEPHAGCIIVWPQRPGSWSFGAQEACRAFTEVIKAIAVSEKVYVACGAADFSKAKTYLAGIENIELLQIETEDSWARDIGPTFVVRDSCDGRELCAVNWSFNAWGGSVDGLYPDWRNDDAFAAAFAEKYGCQIFDAAPFVLEGGSIHCDGEGTAMVTEACLLSAGRNPQMTKQQIEEMLKAYLGVQQIIWLPRGIYNDETNEHVDNICAFIRPGEVVLAWTDDKEDPQYELSLASLQTLEQSIDAKGRKLLVHKLPIPKVPVCITEDEVIGFDFADGEDMREAGERLAASYVNFYFSNDSVIMPAFGGENVASDELAAAVMSKLCPERRIVQISARAILTGGGNIHCITQQIPKGVCL